MPNIYGAQLAASVLVLNVDSDTDVSAKTLSDASGNLRTAIDLKQDAVAAGGGLSWGSDGVTLNAEVTQDDLDGLQDAVTAGDGLSWSADGVTLNAEVQTSDITTLQNAIGDIQEVNGTQSTNIGNKQDGFSASNGLIFTSDDDGLNLGVDVDSSPTAGSDKLLTSGAISSALAELAPHFELGDGLAVETVSGELFIKADVDTQPGEGSDKLLSSGAIFDSLGLKQNVLSSTVDITVKDVTATNLGIGRSPSSGFKIDVAGTGKFNSIQFYGATQQIGTVHSSLMLYGGNSHGGIKLYTGTALPTGTENTSGHVPDLWLKNSGSVNLKGGITCADNQFQISETASAAASQLTLYDLPYRMNANLGFSALYRNRNDAGDLKNMAKVEVLRNTNLNTNHGSRYIIRCADATADITSFTAAFNTPAGFACHINGSLKCSGSVDTSSDDRIKFEEVELRGRSALESIAQLRVCKYTKITSFRTDGAVQGPEDLDENENNDGASPAVVVEQASVPVGPGIWIPTDEEWASGASGDFESATEIGVIAQEVKKIPEFAEFVRGEEMDADGNQTPLSVDYQALFCTSITAIQELKSQVEDLKSLVGELKSAV